MKKRYLLIVMLTIRHFFAFSQTFEGRDTLKVSAENILDGHWADITHDGTLEYVALLQNQDSVFVTMFFMERDTLNHQVLLAKEGIGAQFEIVDLTQDGLLDILLTIKTKTTSTLEIYPNNEGLDFDEGVMKIDDLFAHSWVPTDLKRNGSKEILAIVEEEGILTPRLYAYKEEIIGWDTLQLEYSEGITFRELLAIDLQKDGWDDILLGGINEAGDAELILYQNNKGKLDSAGHDFDYPELLKMSKVDLDADGDFEIFYHGEVGATTSLYYYHNTDSSFVREELVIDPDSVLQFFAADFNSDGFVDIVLKSSTGGELKNELMLNDGNLSFSSEEIFMSDHQDFGDWDWDGDLDILQFKKIEDSLEVVLLDNSTVAQNLGPTTPTQSMVFPQSNSITISWDSVKDDHTNQAALTYDLYLKKEGITLSPGFKIENPYRIVVAHGNQNTLTEVSYHELDPGIYEYGIQAVDNAYYAGGGLGDIHRGQFVICDNVQTNEYIVCTDEEYTLIANGGKTGTWYSSRQGYLGTSDSLNLIVEQDDQIFFSVHNSLFCEDQEVWSFDVQESGEIEQLPDLWACEGNVLELKIDDYWKSIKWTSQIKGDLSDSTYLTYEVVAQDTVTVSLESYQGCAFQDVFSVNVSSPEISLSGEIYRILKGESVQLSVGGGDKYIWEPSEGLNDPLIANPLASPEKTTLYTVQVTDSLGCKALASIQVIVESEAFIPNLFTPNQDQRNDVLKIYGLEEVNEFTFKIYNRSGGLVYETNNLDEAIAIGWDGTRKGKPQPNGVYYWRISGTYKNGNPVYLNGKNSGAIHLLR
ncbi:gliding motility-associated C-terminal domain-containing protein [Xanthovirga aplysinae]|uniref:T9SS type B sorting domain-containing protein n=1 Tax=Xanthovirga aplysinae TaxID=2529853 RepID=UPI0012BCFCB0|nr:gliding motility-associated C-terminal domain-containing protein [Xanthovirga aplysinae]MTI31024.1 T9SS type B sorting domain-containing protein [Xanthovirga aplysinae]